MITELHVLLQKLRRRKINKLFLERIWSEYALKAITPEDFWLLKHLSLEHFQEEFRPAWADTIPIYQPRDWNKRKSKKNKRKLSKCIGRTIAPPTSQRQQERLQGIFYEGQPCGHCGVGKLIIRIHHKPPKLSKTYWMLYWFFCKSCRKVTYDSGTQIKFPSNLTRKQFNQEWYASYGRMTINDVRRAIERDNTDMHLSTGCNEVQVELFSTNKNVVASPRA